MNYKKKARDNLWMIAQLPFPEENYIEYCENLPIKEEQFISDCKKSKRNLQELGVLKEIENSTKKLKILDIGFGNGNAIKTILDANKNCLMFGIEPSKNRFNFAYEKFIRDENVYLIYSTLEDYISDSNMYDYILSLATVEHLKNPLLLIQKMYELLAPNGKIILTFTNSEGLIPRLNLSKWRSADPEHHWLPGKKSMFKLLDYAGFKVLKYFTYGGISSPRNFLQEILNRLLKIFNLGDILVLIAEKKNV
jgi:2-polyprenyl-3-methyl-5-hydroxy-6-metoxy-1,4-benzoquinol methylase